MSQPDPSDDRSAVDTEDGGEQLQPVPNWVSDTWISCSPLAPPPPSDLVDTTAISQLVDSEPDFMPLPDYLRRFRDRSVHVTSRQDSVNWILKVNAHYRFSPVTALLAVNYFDRFLSAHSFPACGWPFQLLSVACLSLAGKLVEPQVPLLMDLQVLELEPIFGPAIIQRMELRVLTGLNWKLRSVTPFDYLAHFIIRIAPSLSVLEPHGFFNRILNASSDLVLRTTREFLSFRQSTVAAATVLCAAGMSPDLASSDIWSFHETVNKDMVKSCHQLMGEYLVDTCPLAGPNDAATVSHPSAAAPSGLFGVLDAAACASCETRSENPGLSSRVEAEPSAKRLRSSPPDLQK